MVYVVLFFSVLLLANYLFMKPAGAVAEVFTVAPVIAIAVTVLYQVINFIVFGLDPFIPIAATIQFLIAFVISAVFGAIRLKIRT